MQQIKQVLLFLVALLVLFTTRPASPWVYAQRGGGSGGINGGGGSQTGIGASQPLSPSTPNMPIYNVMRGGEIQIDVNLWGFVGSPGHYRVPGSTSLVELLSYAGGPTAQARLVDIRIVHADTAAQQRVQIYNLEAYRDDGDLAQNPLLEPGDTIIVSGRALDVFLQAIGIITNMMAIVAALVTFISLTK